MDDWDNSYIPGQPALQHSGPGVASFVLALIAGAIVFICMIVAGIADEMDPAVLQEDSPLAIVVGLTLLGSVIAGFVGLALAIAGLMQDKRNKVFAVMGLVFNSLVLVGTGLIVLIALLVG